MMDFLEFISRSPGHFIGFIIVLAMVGSFVLNLMEIFSKRNNKKID